MVALNRSSKSQIAARYAAFWHAISQNRIGLLPLVPLNRSVLNRSVFKTQTQLNRKRWRFIDRSVLAPLRGTIGTATCLQHLSIMRSLPCEMGRFCIEFELNSRVTRAANAILARTYFQTLAVLSCYFVFACLLACLLACVRVCIYVCVCVVCFSLCCFCNFLECVVVTYAYKLQDSLFSEVVGSHYELLLAPISCRRWRVMEDG